MMQPCRTLRMPRKVSNTMATVIDPVLAKISVDSGWIGLIGAALGFDTGLGLALRRPAVRLPNALARSSEHVHLFRRRTSMCLLIGEMHFNSSLVPIPVPCIREASTMRSTVLFRSMGIEIQIMNHIWPSFFFSFSRTLCCKSQGIKTHSPPLQNGLWHYRETGPGEPGTPGREARRPIADRPT
ncbi:hypothetical protein VTN31DRAFT_1505 [Thermomyces dupontii]|uniref:uncharacterized protein n=1 Tax=Talaromyces thermophilus TaxID=28565 RepID=UPI00374349AA